MSSKTSNDSIQRITLLRSLLAEGQMSTQEDLVAELRSKSFAVGQSTISRDLSRLGAIKMRDGSGRVVYRLPDDIPGAATLPAQDLANLLVSVRHNGSMIVIQTTPGSASLVARQLDQSRPEGILGTIAGDDTIFVAPSSSKKISQTVAAIISAFS
jgi:transcriptional regulator of arginine metabolism